MTLINPTYHDHHENCPECNATDSLELFDKNDDSYNYQYILNTHDLKCTDNKSLRYFKCNKCGAIFKIDWCGCVPIPLNEDKITDFIETNKQLKIKEKE